MQNAFEVESQQLQGNWSIRLFKIKFLYNSIFLDAFKTFLVLISNLMVGANILLFAVKLVDTPYRMN